MSHLLSVESVSRHFVQPGGRLLRAVDDVSFTLDAGEVLGIVGESGCGKSTLARCLVGLHPLASGSIRFRDTVLPAQFRPRDHQWLSRRIQMIFQDPLASLNPRMTVEEILGEALYFRGVREAGERHRRARDWLARVGLPEAALARYPNAFSGGQQQRIGIARALAMEPEVLVCDEPISALDVSIQAQIVNLLADLRAETGVAMVFIAHDLAMVRFLADRVMVMYQGRVMETGPAKVVFAAPAHPYTQLLVASSPVPDPVLARAHLQQGAGAVGGLAPGEGQVVTAGCVFSPRCSQAVAACAEGQPALVACGNQRRAACIHLGR